MDAAVADTAPDLTPDMMPDAVMGTCPNGVCGIDESRCSCPQDCSAPCCGDTMCEGHEDACDCPEDCPGPCCGAVGCEAALGETTCNCSVDCGPCCGNGVCDATEDDVNCMDDCAPGCPNGSCDASETGCACPIDCPTTSCCGNNICEAGAGENDSTCAADCGCSVEPSCYLEVAPIGCRCDACCGFRGDCCVDAETACRAPLTSCGNGQCDCGEDRTTCVVDCTCGNGDCELQRGEDHETCPDDCGCVSLMNCGGPGGFMANGDACYCDNCCFVAGDCCSDALVACPMLVPTCPNGTCEFFALECENVTNCPVDCHNMNGTCDHGETNATSPGECFCGNGRCDDDEDDPDDCFAVCEADCCP